MSSTFMKCVVEDLTTHEKYTVKVSTLLAMAFSGWLDEADASFRLDALLRRFR